MISEILKKDYDNLEPDYSYDTLTDISAYSIKKMGVKAIALDLDNTVLPYGSFSFDEKYTEWVKAMTESGIPVIIISNTVLSRAFILSKKLGGIPFVAPAFKPSVLGLKLASKKLNIPASKIAMIGDQADTDILAANKIGAVSIKVNGIKERETKRARVSKKTAVAALISTIR